MAKKEHSTHDGVLRELRKQGKTIDANAIADAFVVSLGQRPGFWRTPLIALAMARAAPSHRITKTFSGGICKECGLSAKVKLEELEPENSTLLPDMLGEALLTLRQASDREPPSPTKGDIRRLRRLLAIVGELPDNAREGQLSKAISSEKLIPGNKYDRRHIIETLGACGVLETPEHPGFTTRWTSFAARQDRPNPRVECDPPIAFWSAAHGVSAANVKTWFGHLGVSAPASSRPRPGAVMKHSAASAKREARAARVTEFVIGDAVAFAIKRRWVAGVVVDLFREASGTSPVVELLEWSGSSPPTKAALRGVRASGTRWGKDKIRAPLILYGLWSRDDRRGRWAFVASGVRRPVSKHLRDPFEGSPSVQRVDDMVRLAKKAELI